MTRSVLGAGLAFDDDPFADGTGDAARVLDRRRLLARTPHGSGDGVEVP
jgi:hypothetical protein